MLNGFANFFDLNELECRLIAPRLAFQKIFQAPRGRQLKITGNVVNVPAGIAVVSPTSCFANCHFANVSGCFANVKNITNDN